MKINYGCGRHVEDDWFNIDAAISPHAKREPDLLFAMQFDAMGRLKKPTPLENECADELKAIHVLEHFYAWEAPAVLTEWRRLLKPGGRLVLELPNLDLACRNVLGKKGDAMTMWALYGDPAHRDPYMCHRWAYNPQSLGQLLIDCGFFKPKFLPPQTHGRKIDRDMRCEAVRP